MLTQLYGKPLVKPANIESEIDKIRSAAAAQDTAKEQAATGTAAPRGRATLSNLVLVNTSGSAEGVDVAIDGLIDALCVSYPSRFFIVDANLPADAGVGGTGMATAVSSRCVLAESGAHVCSEEVYVSTELRSIPMLRNLLVSLFAPDVDIILIILGDATGANAEGVESILKTLVPIADRIVYDSSGFRDYPKMLKLLLDPDVDVDTAFCKLSDVNWKRTRQWRAMIAEGFDSERLSEAGGRINRLSLVCQRSADDLRAGKLPPDALLLAGWILSSLSCAPEKGAPDKTASGVSFHCTAASGPLVLDLGGEPDSNWNLSDVFLRSLEVTSESADETARLKIERRPERGSAELLISVVNRAGANADSTSRQTAFLAAPIDELVLSHVMARREDVHYTNALKISLGLSESSRTQ